MNFEMLDNIEVYFFNTAKSVCDRLDFATGASSVDLPSVRPLQTLMVL